MKHLYICRHGESQANAQLVYAGRVDTPLTDRGRAQAHQAASHAMKLSLDLIVASPLVRALETAQIIAHELAYPAQQIVQNKLFMERNLGELQGKSFDFAPESQDFPGMESEDALRQRALQAFDYIHSLDADRILLVSHGTFLNMLRNIVADYTADEELPNATIVRLV